MKRQFQTSGRGGVRALARALALACSTAAALAQQHQRDDIHQQDAPGEGKPVGPAQLVQPRIALEDAAKLNHR